MVISDAYGKEANHHRGHIQANRILSPLESIDQFFELLLAICASFLSRFEGRGYLLDCTFREFVP